MSRGSRSCPLAAQPVVRAFAEDEKGRAGHRAHRDPTACRSTSLEVLSQLRREGIEAERVELVSWKGAADGLRPDDRDADPIHLFHYTVACDRWSIDFAAKQFDPDADVPQILRSEELAST
jgi:hypothetical protein